MVRVDARAVLVQRCQQEAQALSQHRSAHAMRASHPAFPSAPGAEGREVVGTSPKPAQRVSNSVTNAVRYTPGLVGAFA